MKTFKIFVPLVLGMVLSAFVQAQDGAKPHKWGVGIGYYATPTVGDSIRPFELSVNYKLSEKQTLYVSVPLYYNRDARQNKVRTEKQVLWGIDVGYKHTLAIYKQWEWFVGMGMGFQMYRNTIDQQYQTRELISYSHPQLPPVIEVYHNVTDYFWDRLSMFSISPEVGIRTSMGNMCIEASFVPRGMYAKRKARSYGEELNIATNEISESGVFYYPDREVNRTSLQPLVKFNLSYYF